MSASFQLVMRAGPNPGLVFPLEAGQLTIGRDPGNAIVIADAEVSRKHARLTLQKDGYLLEDLGSTNGTFVNGQRLSGPYKLQNGDLIALGEQVVLAYESTVPDPAATVVSPKSAGHAPAAKPTPARPIPAPPPSAAPVRPVSAPPPPAAVPSSFAGQVPQGPLPGQPPASPRKTSTMILIALGVLFVCACLALLVWLWFAPPEFYCRTVPFLFPGACP